MSPMQQRTGGQQGTQRWPSRSACWPPVQITNIRQLHLGHHEYNRRPAILAFVRAESTGPGCHCYPILAVFTGPRHNGLSRPPRPTTARRYQRSTRNTLALSTSRLPELGAQTWRAQDTLLGAGLAVCEGSDVGLLGHRKNHDCCDIGPRLRRIREASPFLSPRTCSQFGETVILKGNTRSRGHTTH